ncbi:MAG: glutamate--tRNA ligase [Candidatus Berkiellales bacterium]
MVITRFAPSPTGFLHVGSARTALFCWLWAKKNHGKFILRIEDTDLERSTQEAVDAIIDSMNWLGLNWDEGPFFQTKRFDRYHQIAKQLLEQGHAYKCYCSKERLEVLREQQVAAKEKPRYDGYCLRYPPAHADMPYVLRFKTPKTGTIVFDDLVRGRIEIQNAELDDLIIERSDRSPTYNFTVVVDDVDMGITHVLRGDDHINNTPRQIHIFKALNKSIPEYGHMPMLLGPDGKRLSKRHGAVSVMQYRDEGILPKALINYLVRLGWSHGDQEIFSVEEMINYFDVNAINVAPTALNPEKLLWLNQHYLKTEPESDIANELKWYLEKLGIDVAKGPDLKEIVIAQRERCKTLVEMAEKSQFFYTDDIIIEGDLSQKHFTDDAIKALHAFAQRLKSLSNWTKDSIHDQLKSLVEELGIKLGVIAQPLRVAITGSTVSPPIDVTLYLLGKERTLQRLTDALSQIEGPGLT